MIWLAMWASALLGFIAGILFKCACDHHARVRRETDWDEAREMWP